MLDIKFIRKNPDIVTKAIEDRGVDLNLNDFLTIDKTRSLFIGELEEMKAKINKSSKEKPDEETIKELQKIKGSIKEKQEELSGIEEKYQELMLQIPNIPHKDMPIGKGEDDNVELKRNGDFKEKEWRKDHLEIGEKLDIIDVKQSALVTGSRFSYLKNEAVLIQDALHLMLRDELLKHDFKPMLPPVMVKEQALIGTSHFPEGKDQIYEIKEDYVEDKNRLYLIGSAEPSLFAYFMNKTIGETPEKMFALTSCFRTEVGSWGKDVRGIKRVHQFDKLEMDVVCSPDQSEDIFKELLKINEWFLQSLEIPYRVMNKCSGDAGYIASHLQYDVEAWLPSQEEFMEVMTDTLASDFQARRLNIKYKDKSGKKSLAHTVNDTGCAMGRMIIAILDNHQQKDGSVKLPKTLTQYTGFKEIPLKSS